MGSMAAIHGLRRIRHFISVHPRPSLLIFLTMMNADHGVTKSITFPIASLGAQAGPRGGVVAGFGDGLLKLNRHDFGISYGKGVLGDEVEISMDVEAVKVEPKAAASK